MDFDSIVSILIIIAFFILPSILKQIKAGKSKAGKIKVEKKSPEVSSVPKKKPSVFGKIGEQIRQFMLELEQQAQQQRQAQADKDQTSRDQAGQDQSGKDQANIWDLLTEDEELYEDASQLEELVSDLNLNFEKVEQPEVKKEPEKKALKRKVQNIETPSISTVPAKSFAFKSNQLQNAIVWSEILSKPVALRKD